MSLLTLVEHAAGRFLEKPSCIVLDDLEESNGSGVGKSSDRRSVFSYQGVWNNVKCHERWLLRKIRDCCFDGQYSNDLVVAYLSSNSVDLWLSLLSCTSVSVPAIGALLNTRWTSKEMAQALEFDRGHVSTKPTSYFNKRVAVPSRTIILYGPGFQGISKQVVSYLGHGAICLPIPSFGANSKGESADTLIVQNQFSAEPRTMKYPSYMPGKRRTTKPTDTRGLIQQNILDMDTTSFIRWAENNKSKVNHYDDALIVFTSGTTSKAKGVRLSHSALAIQALAKREKPCGYSDRSVLLASTVPLFHVGGLSSCLATLFVGGTLVFPGTSPEPTIPARITQATANHTRGGFDVSVVQASLSHATWPITTLVVVPAMLVSLFSHFSNQHLQPCFPKVSLLLIGGQSASDKTIGQARSYFPNARIVQTYACTEAASSLTFLQVYPNPPAKSTSPQASTSNMGTGTCVGSSPDHVELRLFRQLEKHDHASNKADRSIITTPRQPGIIATRGPHVMNGYWKRGSQGDAGGSIGRMGSNNWLWTNDLGYWDEQGQLYFCGRVNDAIRTGGETVLAQEVENILLSHPEISECAVFAKADEKFGEAVACAIVLASNNSKASQPQLGSLKKWCSDHGLANYKRPRYMFLVGSLPRNSSGKVLKHKLIQMYGRQQSKL